MIPYKSYFRYLLKEGQFQDLAKAKLTRAGLEREYNKLENLDRTATKKHLPKLADFFIETNNFEILNDYYQRFLNTTLRDKDINQFKTWHDFENIIDGADFKIENQAVEVSGDPVYEDQKIKVFKAASQKACVEYGNGYSFCISNKNLPSNSFYSYRFQGKDELSVYFVRFKNRPIEIENSKFVDPLHLIVLHVGKNNILLTGADNGSQGNGTKNITKENLLKRFPELQTAWNSNVFSVDKYTKTEQDILDHLHNRIVSNEQFLKFSSRLKSVYIQMGKELTDEMWSSLLPEHKLMYIESGTFDLSDKMKSGLGEKSLSRYWQKIKQRVEIKLENEINLSTDETKYYFNVNKDKILKLNVERIGTQLRLGTINVGDQLPDIPSVKLYGTITGEFGVKFPPTVPNYFDCSGNRLTSLVGCPENVGGSFNCHQNKLTSLVGGPENISGNFNCSGNRLTSLVGCPENVGGDFNCYQNKLASLDGCQKTVIGDFNCNENKLTSLVGGPENVGKYFNCNYNNLTSLAGCPKKVGTGFLCVGNLLTSLVGSPKTVGGNFNCSGNQLTSLVGGPENVGGDFNCSVNRLVSLVGCPKTVGGNFNCKVNATLFSVEYVMSMCDVKGRILVYE